MVLKNLYGLMGLAIVALIFLACQKKIPVATIVSLEDGITKKSDEGDSSILWCNDCWEDAVPLYYVDSLDADTVYNTPEISASPKGGFSDFYGKFIANELHPHPGKEAAEGFVFIEFIVDRSGALKKVKVVKGLGKAWDDEALRVIKLYSAWIPANHLGKRVQQRLILPIKFNL